MLKKLAISSKIEEVINFCSKRKITFSTNSAFSKLTTIGCGGKIAVAIFPKNVKQLIKTARVAVKCNVPYVILGQGSNVLASDKNFDGVVICTRGVKGLKLSGNTATAECGVHTVALAVKLAKAGLSGGEFLFCLPATVGGATVMNAGCFGQEMSYIVKSVTILTKDGRLKNFTSNKCGFGYRTSVFQTNGAVVLSVKLAFMLKASSEVTGAMRDMFAKKSAAQPLKEKSMGCVFYSDDKTASAKIDLAGLKGAKVGGASVSVKHAGFIVNENSASSNDVAKLMRQVKETVAGKFNLQLKTEVRLVGWQDEFKN